MAATHHLFNYAAATTSAAIPTSASDHLSMLGLRDVVFISPHHQQHQHQPQPIFPSSSALGVGVSIFPLLDANPCVEIAGPDPQASSGLAAAAAAAKKDNNNNIPMGIEIGRFDSGGGNGNSGGGVGSDMSSGSAARHIDIDTAVSDHEQSNGPKSSTGFNGPKGIAQAQAQSSRQDEKRPPFLIC